MTPIGTFLQLELTNMNKEFFDNWFHGIHIYITLNHIIVILALWSSHKELKTFKGGLR